MKTDNISDFRELQEIQDNFIDLTGIPAIIVDEAGNVATCPGQMAPICATIEAECTPCAGCRAKLAQKAVAATKPSIQQCPLTGLWTATAVVAPAGRRVGSWIVGHARLMDRPQKARTDDFHELDAMVNSAPIISSERFSQLIHFLYSLSDAAERLLANERENGGAYPGKWPGESGKLACDSQLFRMLNEVFLTVLTYADVSRAFDEALRIVGEQYHVSRAFAFMNVDGPLYANTHEWCAPGVQSQKAQFQEGNIAMTVKGLEQRFRQDGVITANEVSGLPADLRGALGGCGIASVAMLPIWHDDQLIGFVGLDDEKPHRWSTEELLALWNVAMVFSDCINRPGHRKRRAEGEDVLINILNSTGLNVFVADAYSDEILWVNDTLRQNYGSGGRIVGRKCYEVIQGRKEHCPFCKVQHLLKNPQQRQIAWETHNEHLNRTFMVYDSIVDWVDGRKVHIEYSMDTTDFRKRQRELEYFATTDSLTGAVNRQVLMMALRDALRAAARDNGVVSVAFLDIDGLKYVNDTCGHQAGDELIEMTMQAVRNHTRSSDVIGRIGGDEFVIVMPRCDRTIATEHIAKAREKLYCMKIEDCLISPSFSYGIAENRELSYADSEGYAEELISIADERMRVFKRQTVSDRLIR